MRFDYLHAAKPKLLQRISEVRVPERFHMALLVLIGSAAVLGGACAIDAYRLREALRLQSAYQHRYDRAELALKRSKVYYDRVRALLAVDAKVHEIASSGDSDALMLAEIANRLPEHAWLTGIARDPGGFSLAGHARDLAVVGQVMRGLMRAKHVANPLLVSTALVKDRDPHSTVTYEIHVERPSR